MHCSECYRSKTLYIRKFRKKWIKVGSYCESCGRVVLLPEFYKEPHELETRQSTLTGNELADIKELVQLFRNKH